MKQTIIEEQKNLERLIRNKSKKKKNFDSKTEKELEKLKSNLKKLEIKRRNVPVAKKAFDEAKDIVRRYKEQQLKKYKNSLTKNCKCDNVYNEWYNEDHLTSTCRDCFRSWENNYRPFLLSDTYELTDGTSRKTTEDSRKLIEHLEKIKRIENL